MLDGADLKSRFVRNASFHVGTRGLGPRPVHAQLRLLSGRSPEAKQDPAARVAEVLRRSAAPGGVMVQPSGWRS